MPSANRPAGPGRPTTERRDRAAEAEELQELEDLGRSSSDSTPRDGGNAAQQAERDAHVKGQDATAASGTSRDKRRG